MYLKKIVVVILILITIQGNAMRIANTLGSGLSYMDSSKLSSKWYGSIEITASTPQSKTLNSTTYKDFFWIAAGLKYSNARNSSENNLEKQENILMPYGEVGFWLFATCGVGYSRVYGFDSINWLPHAYLGYPLIYKNDQQFFITPFYRRYFGDLDSNEFGFFVKALF